MCASLRDNIRKDVFPNMDPFWGKYEMLNRSIVPDQSMIQQFQLEKLQQFQKVMSDRVAHENAKINALFINNKINSLPSVTKADEEKKLDLSIQEIIKALNSTYNADKNKKRNNGVYNYQKLAQSLQWLLRCLQDLNATVLATNANNVVPIPESYIKTLKQTLAACNMESLDPTKIDEWFKNLNNFKGALVEDIGVSWLSAMDVPNITTINVGGLNYQGSGKYGRKGQLIQDLMTLKASKVDLGKIPITYKTPEGKLVTSSIAQMLHKMENASSQHKQIVLEDSGYETLLQLSALNIQAKAGINQLPWNQSKSTQVKIGQFDNNDNLRVSTRHTFELLHELDQDPVPQKDIWVEDQDKNYNLMADYGLATVLFKILHLEENGNDYILTPQGFTTFTDRIKYLIDKKNSYVNIKEQVKISENTLGESYNVSMVGYH